MGHFGSPARHEALHGSNKAKAHRIRDGHIAMADFFPERERPANEWETTPLFCTLLTAFAALRAAGNFFRMGWAAAVHTVNNISSPRCCTSRGEAGSAGGVRIAPPRRAATAPPISSTAWLAPCRSLAGATGGHIGHASARDARRRACPMHTGHEGLACTSCTDFFGLFGTFCRPV